jgi:hAT family protein
LSYIKLAWGGPVEQAAEIAAGNPHAKSWQGDARKTVEKTVCFIIFIYNYNTVFNTLN